MAKIKVDGKVYPSKKVAEREFFDAMMACEGSEGERMAFAYGCIVNGYTNIDTYNESASREPITEKVTKK